jgi:hypothetical protein
MKQKTCLMCGEKYTRLSRHLVFFCRGLPASTWRRRVCPCGTKMFGTIRHEKDMDDDDMLPHKGSINGIHFADDAVPDETVEAHVLRILSES